MKSARFRFLAKKMKLGQHLIRSMTWELAAQMVEKEWESLNARKTQQRI